MGYMNERYNVMFWINIVITVAPTLQYSHIDHNQEMLMMNEVYGGKKLKFTKKTFGVLSNIRGWYVVYILCNYE